MGFMFVITILNLPSIEYRNFNLFQYTNQSLIKGLPAESNDYTRNFPLRDFKFNHIIFANNIILKKIRGIDKSSISNLEFNNKDIYPMTPIMRIFYLKNYKVDKYDNKLILMLKNYISLLVIIYSFIVFTLLFFYLFFFYKIITKNK